MYSAIRVSGSGRRMTALAVAMVSASAFAQTATKSPPRMAEVTGTDVYVRSGPSSNHYPVVNLGAGARVTVVGENGEWFEMIPPDGAFSFVSGDFVDTSDNKTGVVSGDNVRVRAGSALPDFAKNKYVVQTKLSRGAEVSILSRDPDGYLRIKPPVGVTAWIHSGYVAFLSGSPAPVSKPVVSTTQRKPASVVAPGSAPPKDASKPQDNTAAAAPAKPGDEWTFQGLPETPQRRTVVQLDELVKAEMEKPVEERVFTALVTRYEVVATQTEDELAGRYARSRIKELTQMSSAIATLTASRARNEKLETLRRDFVDQRARLREDLPAIPTGLDAQGVLRTSALYPAGTFPHRYRLTDPTARHERTIAYVELLPNSALDVSAYLGKYIGVRASGKRLQTGGIKPVPIYVAGEIVLLDDKAAANETTDEG